MTKNKDATRYYSDLQEKRVARALGGKCISGSGSSPFYKGDVEVDENFLVSCKTSISEKNSISIKKDWLDSIEAERFSMKKRFPVLAFCFGDGVDYYVITEKAMKEFVQYLRDDVV